MLSEIRWKFVAVIATTAMIVSVLSGGFGGVRFGALIFRALLGGIVFAVFAVAINLLIARLFPEILAAIDFTRGDSETLGAHVDIMAGDDSTDESGKSVADGYSGSDDLMNWSDEGGDSMGLGDVSNVFGEEEKSREDSHSVSDLLEGDYGTEEIAQAVQTVMKRDKKG